MGNLKGAEILTLLVLLTMFALSIWLAFWIGKTAARKGYSRAGFTIFGLFFTLIALIVVLVLQPTQAVAQQGLTKCPWCAENIQEQAIICKHCGKEITTT